MAAEFPGLTDVISNNLIIRCLEQYISYDDIKICRLVCRTFNQSIVEESKFSSRTKLIVQEDIFRSEVIPQLSFKLRHADVYLFSWFTPKKRKLSEDQSLRITRDQLEPLYNCFQNVESLMLYDSMLPKEINDEVLPDVSRLIRATESLKELQLSALDVRFCLSRQDFPDLENKLKNVAVLHLLPPGLNPSDIVNFPTGRFAGCLRGVKNLQILNIRHGFMRDFNYLRNEMELLVEVIEVISRNANSIRSLGIFEPALWKLMSLPAERVRILEPDISLSNIQFPNLREVCIRVQDSQNVEVCKFLGVHLKQLNSLNIRMLGQFHADVVDLIRNEGKKLKKLKISATDSGDEGSPNLAFLLDFQELESFKLQILLSSDTEPDFDSMSVVFAYVPIKKLRKLAIIHGTPSISPLNHDKIQALCGLKYLALDWCETAVDDDTLNAIFKNMTQLEYLRITRTSTCGIRGFTGTESTEDPTPEPGKVAASNLTKLKQLVLQECGVDDHIVKVAFKFKNLELLDISRNLKVTKVSCEVAVTQNPTLRVLRTRPFHPFNGEDYTSELKAINPRFKLHECLPFRKDEGLDSSDDDPDDDTGSDFTVSLFENAYSGLESDDSDLGGGPAPGPEPVAEPGPEPGPEPHLEPGPVPGLEPFPELGPDLGLELSPEPGPELRLKLDQELGLEPGPEDTSSSSESDNSNSEEGAGPGPDADALV